MINPSPGEQCSKYQLGTYKPGVFSQRLSIPALLMERNGILPEFAETLWLKSHNA